MSSANNPIRVTVALLGVSFVLLGFCFMLKTLTIPIPPLWLSAILMIIGLTMIAPSDPKLQIGFGFLFLISGTLLALKSVEIISDTVLRYSLGGFLAFAGVLLIIYSVVGGTPKTSNNPDP